MVSTMDMNKKKICIAVVCAIVLGLALWGGYSLIYGKTSSTGNEVLVKESLTEIKDLVIESREAVADIKKEVKGNAKAITTTVQKTISSYSVDGVARSLNSMLKDYRDSK